MEQIQSNTISVAKTAHYYTIGSPGIHIKRIIFAFHGYGQAARKFVYKFEGFDDGKTLVVCPEGLSRFYWENFTGDVVSSWMTKQDREDDIKDNMAYISQLYEHILSQNPKEVDISIFGFSQGCPTASRWVASYQPKIKNMVIWAGQLAHDQDYLAAKEYFQGIRLVYVYGNEDQYLPYGMKDKMLSKAHASEMEFEVKEFNGKHTIDREVLQDIYDELNNVQKLF